MVDDLYCISGEIWRHDPQPDDPDFFVLIGRCPDCSGDGCGDDGEPVPKYGRSVAWMRGVRP